MITTQTQPKFVPAGTGPLFCGPGDRLRFLLTGSDTDGALFLAECDVAVGGGPPPHIHHREDESFYLLQGTLSLRVGKDEFRATAGDFIHIPRGTVHAFRNVGSDAAKMLVAITPAGLEHFFAEAFYPGRADSEIPLASPDLIERLVNAAPKHNLELLPPE